MTATETQERERHARISTRWAAYPNYSYADIAAAVDVELAQEAERQAEGQAWVDDQIAGMRRLWSCQVCGESRGPGVRDGFCPSCRSVVARVRAERFETEQVNGHTRRRLAEHFLERTSKAT